MKCPYCGSTEIIWDSKGGNVVCANCGSVLDRVYITSTAYEEQVAQPSIQYELFYEIVKREREFKRVFNRNGSKWRKIVVHNGALVRETSLPAMKLIESNERFLIIYDFVNSLPQFRTKTIKNKLAIGLYLFDKKEFEKYRRQLDVSEKYIKKLLITKLKMADRTKIQQELKKRLSLR